MAELDLQSSKASLRACNRDHMAKNVDERQHALPWSKVRKGDKDPIEEKDAWAAVARMPVVSA